MNELKHHDHYCNAIEDLGNNVTAGNTENVESKFETPSKEMLTTMIRHTGQMNHQWWWLAIGHTSSGSRV